MVVAVLIGFLANIVFDQAPMRNDGLKIAGFALSATVFWVLNA